jgi:ketosteroid isomerase-like protein
MDVSEWAERYARAWEDGDKEAAAELFSEDATYRSNIFEDPHRGRDGIRSYWHEVTSTQGNVRVRMGRPLVDGDRVALEWWTTMDNEGAPVTLPGCLLLRFGEDGLCRSLHEYYLFGEGHMEPTPEWGGGGAS